MLRGTKIWQSNVNVKDVYVDFLGDFCVDGKGKVFLRISCDSAYTVWINGKLASFGACADYPEYRNFDKIDISKHCQEKNHIKITVWHYGEDSQTYINAEAFLLFDVIQGEKILLKSSKDILSAVNANYKNGYRKNITHQLGYSFCYDANSKQNEFLPSDELGEGVAVMRKRKQCRLKRRAEVKIQAKNGGYLVDLGKETVGFIDLQFFSPCEQKLHVSYAEHLTHGEVCNIIDGRDFSVEYVAKAGENAYINTFRRLACRYLFVKCDTPIRIDYIGICPTEYPLIAIKRKFSDKLLQKIYDTSVYTLKCCMHEHYEDCPWREQALYTMDSRNQMLCGYYAFKGSLYQRENLILISKGVRSDGLLSLCFPAGLDYPIPFFSLVYVMQVWEYIEHTGDRSVLREVGRVIKDIISVFNKRVEQNGLIADFENYWNFYEWTEGSHNDWQINQPTNGRAAAQYDLILNCFYIIACRYYEKLFGEKTDTSRTAQSIQKVFYSTENGLFKLSNTGEEIYSQLGNSMAILAKVAPECVARNMIENPQIVKVSLSMTTFYYDALLSVKSKDYSAFILNDIKEKYGNMLNCGATTFWETQLGWQDFGGAGSLCHGWSAIAMVYILRYAENN